MGWMQESNKEIRIPEVAQTVGEFTCFECHSTIPFFFESDSGQAHHSANPPFEMSDGEPGTASVQYLRSDAEAAKTLPSQLRT
jgi:hypothetical protein